MNRYKFPTFKKPEIYIGKVMSKKKDISWNEPARAWHDNLVINDIYADGRIRIWSYWADQPYCGISSASLNVEDLMRYYE